MPGPGFPDRRDHSRAAPAFTLPIRLGRGSVVLRGKTHDRGDWRKDREAIVITEVPYQVNKARMVERIAEWCARS